MCRTETDLAQKCWLTMSVSCTRDAIVLKHVTSFDSTVPSWEVSAGLTPWRVSNNSAAKPGESRTVILGSSLPSINHLLKIIHCKGGLQQRAIFIISFMNQPGWFNIKQNICETHCRIFSYLQIFIISFSIITYSVVNYLKLLTQVTGYEGCHSHCVSAIKTLETFPQDLYSSWHQFELSLYRWIYA